MKIPQAQADLKPTRIKLLFLIGQLGLGGSEHQLYLLIQHLDRNLFECHVLVFNPSPNFVFDEALEKLGVKVWCIPPHCRGVLQRVVFVYRRLRQLAPDIVHSWTFYDNPYAGLVGWMAGVAVRLGSLRNSFSLPGMQKLLRFYRWLSLYSVSGLVANSKAVQAELAARGYPEARVTLVYNCVSRAGRAPRPTSVARDLTRFGIEEHHFLVGTVGNLRRIKNQLMFVEGMALVLKHCPAARGLIVGHPIETGVDREIEAAISKLGLHQKVALAGFRGDVPDLMQRFDAFCLTSRSEGMPNVVLEAMISACPVVATRVGGVAEIIEDGVNGFLVEPDDVKGLADIIERLIRDRAVAKRVGAAGQALAEQNFGCVQAARQMMDLYTSRLKQARPTPHG